MSWAGRDGSEPDTRLMVHAQINVIRELFVQRGDDAGLSMLSAIERECC
ncbi:N(2)-fixation sustaining protein CowN [Halorhodospira halophila]